MTTEAVVTEHEVCQTNVEVPTIGVGRLVKGGEPEVFVQWFGDAHGTDLKNRQFRFPVPANPDDMHWMGHPESFKVILLGQAKSWPGDEARRRVIAALGGDPEKRVLWVTSKHYGTRNANGDGPACFMVPMNLWLADQMCGVITPRHYLDLEILEREKREYATSRSKA